MTSRAACTTWPAGARPLSGAATPTHRARTPRFPPAPARIPSDPAAQDHHWPEYWPLRTQLELAALDTAPGCARAHVCAVLREWRADPEGIDVAALVVSELLTNAVLSTRAHLCPDPVRMWMLGDGTSVLFLVWDATVPAPVQVSATAGDEHGRGLTLINDLCEQWGHYHPTEHPGGKVVWALLRATPAPEAAYGKPCQSLDTTRGAPWSSASRGTTCPGR